MQEVNLYTATGARGPRKQTAGYVYILEVKTEKGPATLTGSGMLTGTKNRLEVRVLNLALERVNKLVSIHFYTDSAYLSTAFLQGLPEKWEQQGWKNAKGAAAANREEWQKTLDLLCGKPLYIHKNENHEYRNWIERELEKTGGEKHV